MKSVAREELGGRGGGAGREHGGAGLAPQLLSAGRSRVPPCTHLTGNSDPARPSVLVLVPAAGVSMPRGHAPGMTVQGAGAQEAAHTAALSRGEAAPCVGCPTPCWRSRRHSGDTPSALPGRRAFLSCCPAVQLPGPPYALSIHTHTLARAAGPDARAQLWGWGCRGAG